MLPFLTALVNSWNYHIGLEDAAVMQGQAHRIEDRGAPRMAVGGLGDDLIKRYWRWRQQAHESLEPSESGIQSPYSMGFMNNGQNPLPSGIATGTAFGDAPRTISAVKSLANQQGTSMVSDDGNVDTSNGFAIGSWGIKQNYLQETPAANFPPMNYKRYANLLVLDDLVKSLFAGQETSYTMVKSQLDDFQSKPSPVDAVDSQNSKRERMGRLVAACQMAMVFNVALGATWGRSLAYAIAEALPSEGLAIEKDILIEKARLITTFLPDLLSLH